eukprot:CAMPEP_0194506162 /NCGR_PEP_ID=MMETSP0253-20130528/34025_1 /TAXON_ID=2966 /ORGANISM="Noctiluca scintillans" /LENGTH=169 /DNA_ID=CAMNT_0039348823 /DNA_START=18 /DNA_END=527 /DNA_ORIENTATION=+
MPLCKIFTEKALKVSAAELHAPLCKIWGVPCDVLKVLVLPMLDQSSIPGEDIFISVRAKQKPERTPKAVQANLNAMSALFLKHGHRANIRLELYEASLQATNFVGASLADAFRTCDLDDTGFITADDLRQLTTMDQTISVDMADQIILDRGLERDGKINYLEFLQALPE